MRLSLNFAEMPSGPRQFLLTLSSMLVRPFLRASRRRWLGILALNAVGLLWASPLFLISPSFTRGFGEICGSIPLPALASILAVMAAPLYILLIRLGGLNWGQWRHLLAFPPAWVAAIPAPFEVYFLKRMFGGLPLPEFDLATSAWAMGICVAGPLLCLIGHSALSNDKVSKRRPTATGGSSTAEQSLRAFVIDDNYTSP